jgi:cytochrome c oxidase assembly factor CtaG
VKMVLADLPEGVLRDPYVRKWLRSRLPVAIMQAAEHGYADDGLRWYFSPLHRHRILTPGGLWRFARLIHSYLAS